MSAETLTPIPEVYYKTERLRVDIPFPSWVDAENMGINLQKTVRLMNIGGIKHLRVIGDPDGDKTTSMPIGVGINPDGSRSAGMGLARESVKPFSFETQLGRYRTSFRNSEWASVTLNINLEEMQRKIEEKKGDLRKAESWTPHLDQLLRKGVRQAGTEHLLTKFTGWQKTFIFLVDINNTLLKSFNLSVMDIMVRSKPSVPTVDVLLLNISLGFVLWTGMESVVYGRESGSGSGYRISLFPGYEIDRAAILQVLSRTNTLISPVNKGK